jgi:hypothetical protein
MYLEDQDASCKVDASSTWQLGHVQYGRIETVLLFNGGILRTIEEVLKQTVT